MISCFFSPISLNFEPLSSALIQAQVFVESAVKRGKEDKDNYLVQYVRGVFKHLAVEEPARGFHQQLYMDLPDYPRFTNNTWEFQEYGSGGDLWMSFEFSKTHGEVASRNIIGIYRDTNQHRLLVPIEIG